MTPTALTIAGSDSGGGAGIQADLKTFSALGVYGASAITAVTAQNTRAVTAIGEIPAELVAAQMEAVLDDIEVHAVKVGMLFTSDVTRVVAARLREHGLPVVLDPVMVAKSGDALLRDDAAAALIEEMLPLATLVTPNLPEAAWILGLAQAASEEEMVAQAHMLVQLGARAVLMKGGHGTGPTVADFLIVGGAEPMRLEAPRRETQNTHGTGCSLSSAVAAELAKKRPLADAVRRAHAWLQQAISAADDLRVGSGHGPVHHFHAFWPRLG